MGELPDVTPEEQSLAVDELSGVSIDFLSQMTWLWPTSSGPSSSSTKSGTDHGAGAPPLLTCWYLLKGRGCAVLEAGTATSAFC